jgi:hypothetical protein
MLRLWIGVGLALAAAAAGAWLLFLRNPSDPVTVGEAVEELRGEPGDGGAARVDGVAVPPTGVYRYATSGGDRVDAVIDGSHEYPPVTTITVSRGGCGVLMRWAPLDERQSELDLCPRRGGWGLAGITEVHEFFGRRDERRYDCPGGVAFRDRGSWRYACRFDQTVDRFAGRSLGLETLRVGGRPVVTIHVRERNRVSGPEQGTGVTDTWYRASDGLIVRRTAGNANTSSAPGREAAYAEDYSLMLVSPRPLR